SAPCAPCPSSATCASPSPAPPPPRASPTATPAEAAQTSQIVALRVRRCGSDGGSTQSGDALGGPKCQRLVEPVLDAVRAVRTCPGRSKPQLAGSRSRGSWRGLRGCRRQEVGDQASMDGFTASPEGRDASHGPHDTRSAAFRTLQATAPTTREAPPFAHSTSHDPHDTRSTAVRNRRQANASAGASLYSGTAPSAPHHESELPGFRATHRRTGRKDPGT